MGSVALLALGDFFPLFTWRLAKIWDGARCKVGGGLKNNRDRKSSSGSAYRKIASISIDTVKRKQVVQECRPIMLVYTPLHKLRSWRLDVLRAGVREH